MINSPCPEQHLNSFIEKLKKKEPFFFVRFSDGEIEILRNRYLELDRGRTVFRGRVLKNNFLALDTKKFDPEFHQGVRSDLLSCAEFRDSGFYKGIPTSHNNAIDDREFLLRLNGGFGENMTFADLFLNSNYENYKARLVPLFEKYEEIYVIANFRAIPVGSLRKAEHIKIPDNFFSDYKKVLNSSLEKLDGIKDGSLVLSSASSLSNIIAHKLYITHPNITFLDVGTSINHLLSLDVGVREYHGHKSRVKNYIYKKSRRYKIKW